jgi:hypothetical protein
VAPLQHGCRGPPQLVQLPLTQRTPASPPHDFPHVPQLLGSRLRSVQKGTTPVYVSRFAQGHELCQGIEALTRGSPRRHLRGRRGCHGPVTECSERSRHGLHTRRRPCCEGDG